MKNIVVLTCLLSFQCLLLFAMKNQKNSVDSKPKKSLFSGLFDEKKSSENKQHEATEVKEDLTGDLTDQDKIKIQKLLYRKLIYLLKPKSLDNIHKMYIKKHFMRLLYLENDKLVNEMSKGLIFS